MSLNFLTSIHAICLFVLFVNLIPLFWSTCFNWFTSRKWYFGFNWSIRSKYFPNIDEYYDTCFNWYTCPNSSVTPNDLFLPFGLLDIQLVFAKKIVQHAPNYILTPFGQLTSNDLFVSVGFLLQLIYLFIFAPFCLLASISLLVLFGLLVPDDFFHHLVYLNDIEFSIELVYLLKMICLYSFVCSLQTGFRQYFTYSNKSTCSKKDIFII